MAEKDVEFDPRQGFPAGKFLFYECGICGDTMPSMPDRTTACACRNVVIDVDAGRISVKDESKLRLFEETGTRKDPNRR